MNAERSSIATDQLAEAIRHQSLAEVQAAVAAGADPNAYVGDLSMLGLHEDEIWRISERYTESWLGILRALLESGADPNLTTNRKHAPDYVLHAMSEQAVVPAIRMLLEFGANPNLLVDRETALDWQAGDESYIETCHLPDEYKGKELPEYPVPTEAEYDDHYGPICTRWLVSQHQRAHVVLREAGALYSTELGESR